MVKRISLLVIGLLFVSTAAAAGPNWQSITLSIEPENQAKVLAALDKLMAAAGPGGTGSAALMASVAGGDSTHSFISSFDSRAAREAWAQALFTSPAWTQYAKATAGLVERGSSTRMDLLKSWGEETDTDVFWEVYAFSVSDAEAFAKDIDAFVNSETGKKFPGQVHLSAVAAAGVSQATHVISVGFASEAEAESWNNVLAPSKDWEKYQDDARKVSTLVGAFMIRTVKAWNSAAE